MKSNDIILHMVTHGLKRLAKLQLQLTKVNDSKEVDPTIKQNDIVALSTETIELLGMLEPALSIALKGLPEFNVWLVSAQDAIARIKADGGIMGNICECKGCSADKIKGTKNV